MCIRDRSDSERFRNPFVSEDSVNQQLLKGLENALDKRLVQAIYGVKDYDKLANQKGEQGLIRGASRIIDHILFNRLYRVQLGKATIREISSYCTTANSNAAFLQSATSEVNTCVKDENLEKLAKPDNDPENVQRHWQSCLAALPYICQQGTTEAQGNNKAVNYANNPGSGDDSCSYSNYFYPAKNNDCQSSSAPAACLLYTSPSPRDATLSRMPSSA